MAKTLHEQIASTLERSSQILIAFKKDHSADTVASALALKLVLEKMNKHVDIVSDSFVLENTYAFLPQSQTIHTTLTGLQQFKISIDTKKTPLKDISYKQEGDMVHIILTPKQGTVSSDHIATHQGAYRYDLIITVDTEDLESLGSVFQEHPDFFYNTTIINFDHKPENEEFGQINHVDPNATSTAEVLFHSIEELQKQHEKLLDEHIAQCLLCGIIAKTHSFKSAKVTPATLHIASRLMKAGADRTAIVKHLYYTKSIKTLKLWGKVLSRLKSDPKKKIAWSFVTQEDFEELQATPEKLQEVIEELILTAPEAKIILIVYGYKQQLHALLHSDTTLSSKELATAYNPFGSKRLATFKVIGDNPEMASLLLSNEFKTKI